MEAIAAVELRSAPLPPAAVAKLQAAALWHWRKQSECALAARWLRLHSCLYGLRAAALRSRAREAARAPLRGLALRDAQARLDAAAKRLTGRAAMRRWRQGAEAAYERLNEADEGAPIALTGELLYGTVYALRVPLIGVRYTSTHATAPAGQTH